MMSTKSKRPKSARDPMDQDTDYAKYPKFHDYRCRECGTEFRTSRDIKETDGMCPDCYGSFADGTTLTS